MYVITVCLVNCFIYLYILDRVIASSFPSSGSQAIYRNPIEEVARFLDTKHPDHYKVYNLCSKFRDFVSLLSLSFKGGGAHVGFPVKVRTSYNHCLLC